MARTKKDPSADGAPKPAKRRRFAQLRQVKAVYKQSKGIDPAITWWMLSAFVLVEVVMVLIGLAIGHPIYLGILGLPLAVLAAGLVMARRAERAAYRQLEGQTGGGGAALGALRRGWYYEQQPVAVEATRPGDMSSAAMVFRAVRKLAGKIQRLRPALTKAEASAVNKRLKALGGARPPVPKGIDPMRARPDRKGMRGR